MRPPLGRSGGFRHVTEWMVKKARAHASASMNVCRVDPLESVFLSILLEHEMEIRALRAQLSAQRSNVARASDGS